MKSSALVALVAILVVGSLGLGYLSGASARSTRTVTSTATLVSTTTTQVTVAAQGPSTTTSTVVNASCTVTVPPPQGIYLRVVSDGGTPVSGLDVTSQYEVNASCGSDAVILASSVVATNSSGWMLFQAGYPWFFVFSYSGQTYNFTVSSDPIAWTLATISVPSGNLTTQVCGVGGVGPATSCQPAVDSTVRPAG